MKIKLVKITVMALTLATIGYMSISAQTTTSTGGKGLSEGKAYQNPSANSITDSQAAGGGAAPIEAPKAEIGGCCG